MERLAAAISAGRFPQATLLVGAPGVGKQRLSLWIAQALLCEKQLGHPCGMCLACRQAVRLGHPDLHWFQPLTGLQATDSAKQVDEVAELIAQAAGERSENPLWGPPEGMARHPLASIRLLQRVLAVRPFQGERRAVVLSHAERLVVQEASQEAANALLKMLEEPPAGTYLVVTTSDAQALLPTVRSRLVPLRVQGVGDEAVRQFLRRELDPPLDGEALEQRVLLAEGSIGKAISAEGESAAASRAAGRLLKAVKKGGGEWSGLALGQAPWAARGDFTAMLDELLMRLRQELVNQTGGAEPAPGGAEGLLEAVRRIEDVRAAAQGNVNPQLGLAALAADLERLV